MIEIIIADLTHEKHANALVCLLNKYAEGKMGGGESLSVFTQKNLAKTSHDRPDTTVILAFKDDEPVGVINCIEGFSRFACKPLINIHDIYVSSECRGEGIATKLFNEVDRLAQEKGCCKITLEVLEGNEPAKKAYQQLGFKAYELDEELGHALFWEKKI